MGTFLVIGIGGFCGAVLRYLVSSNVQRLWGVPFVGTLTVNALGCLLIGFLHGLAESRQLFSAETRMLVLVGFLGSFTTYSTFGYDTFLLGPSTRDWPGLGQRRAALGARPGRRLSGAPARPPDVSNRLKSLAAGDLVV